MNPAMLFAALQMLQSGKLDGLLGAIPGLDKLGGLAGVKSAVGTDSPMVNVMSAVQILAEHLPSDPEKAGLYISAITQTVNGYATLKQITG